MPKININEVDLSRYTAPNSDAPMTVLVPGTASFGPVVSDNNPSFTIFSGENSLDSFYKTYGVNPAKLNIAASGQPVKLATISGDNSFEYAVNLLKSGATIQFYRLNAGTAATGTVDDVLDLISAKFTGRFGNRIICKFDQIANSTTDAIITVYIDIVEHTEVNHETFETTTYISKLTPEYTARVSTDRNSQWFIDDQDLQYVVITAQNLATIITSVNATTNPVITAFANGLDYSSSDVELTEQDALTAVMSSLTSAYTLFADQYLFDFDFVTSGGFIPADDTDVLNLHKSMLSLCKTRKDCIALLDTPENYTYSQTLAHAGNAGLNSSYAAIYAPWCSFVSAASGRTLMMPPSIIFMKAILLGMQNQVDGELWYIPAGVTRASASFVVSPKYEVGSTILNAFQNDNNYRVNPIMKIRNYGYCVYGNSTCMNSVSYAGPSALESMNVRIISNIVKKYIFEVCSGLSFEYNNSELWLKFYSKMDEKLLYMKRNYGLYDYQIKMGSSTVTDANLADRKVLGKVLISPTLAGEFFDIDFEIMPSGVTFDTEEE